MSLLLLGAGPGVDGPGELPAITGVYNFTRANNPNAIAAKAAMLAGSADLRVAYIGDSTVFGQNSTSSGTTGAKSNSVLEQLADLLSAGAIPAISDGMWGLGEAGTPSATMANFLLAESRAGRTGTSWTNQSFAVIGGKSWGVSNGNTTDTFTFTTERACNRCDAYFLRFGSGGAFKFSVDGGAESGAQSTFGTNGMGVHTLNLGASATHTLSLRCADNNVFLIGLVFYDTTARRAVLMNQGACGYTTTHISSAAQPWDWGPNLANPNMGLNLAIIEGGLINDRAAVADPTAAMGRIQAWITALKAQNCDVWLVNPEPVVDSTTVSGAYRTALHDLADSNACTFIDFMTPYATVTGWQGAGYGDPGDLIHPNGAGYGFIAARYASMLEAL